MKKILIVDDNENNRMLLRALLEEYAQDNDTQLNISEAVNGLEASLIAEDEHFHLILMDIMMPEIDGIEATKRIRARDPKVMIVAVSAVDDGDRQRQILQNGAEDYISKPINADIFLMRLSNYFSIIESRKGEIKHSYSLAVNLYTQDVYARQFNFFLTSDDELSEFWEYYLLESSERSEALSDAIRTIYAMASIGIKMGAQLQIIVEESSEHMYVTLVGTNAIDAKIIKLIMVKNSTVTDYKSDDNKFCIRLLRLVNKESLIVSAEVNQSVAVNETMAVQTPVAAYEAVEEELHVYNYMEPDDLLDLQEFVGKLNSLMLVVGSEIELSEVNEISASLQHISRIASAYTDSYSIGQALASMGNTISNHNNEFLAKSAGLAPMCAAFGRDLNSWIQLIFVDGATSVHYMDDTIIANAQMINAILTMDDADHAADSLDDIFDF